MILLVFVLTLFLSRFSIEFPAGLVNQGETLLQASQRELAEETGYSGGNIKVFKCAQVGGKESLVHAYAHVSIS